MPGNGSPASNYQYIENTATIDHGNSGGALVDQFGRLVGSTTANDSSTESSNGNNGGKFLYAVPTSVVSDFLEQNHVVPSSSPDQALYDDAMGLMSQSYHSAALAQAPTDPARRQAANGQVTGGGDDVNWDRVSFT